EEAIFCHLLYVLRKPPEGHQDFVCLLGCKRIKRTAVLKSDKHQNRSDPPFSQSFPAENRNSESAIGATFVIVQRFKERSGKYLSIILFCQIMQQFQNCTSNISVIMTQELGKQRQYACITNLHLIIFLPSADLLQISHCFNCHACCTSQRQSSSAGLDLRNLISVLPFLNRRLQCNVSCQGSIC
ncbi:hypothetical protein LINPERPRIM_LOCUS28214, partial [Linum perenne]